MQLRVFGVALGIVVAAFIVGCNGGEVVKTSTATLAITTTSLSEGTVGSPYSAALAAVGGTSPYSWSILSGSLPPGLSLSASGVISGTATAGATSKITVQAKDSASVQQTATSSLT